MLLTLGDNGYRLMIREVGLVVQVVHIGYGPSNSPHLEKMNTSDEVPALKISWIIWKQRMIWLKVTPDLMICQWELRGEK